MDPRTHAAVTWLLNCDEPAIRLMTRLYAAGERFLSRSSVVCITEGSGALETWVCPAGGTRRVQAFAAVWSRLSERGRKHRDAE
jgi:hypothetical protein